MRSDEVAVYIGYTWAVGYDQSQNIRKKMWFWEGDKVIVIRAMLKTNEERIKKKKTNQVMFLLRRHKAVDTEPEELRQRRGGISRVVQCYVMSHSGGGSTSVCHAHPPPNLNQKMKTGRKQT